MKVLIADFDLFAAMGGGQTFYRSVIESNPAIEFHYLSVSEPAHAPRPANAHAIPYEEAYNAAQLEDFGDLEPPRWTFAAFAAANNVAYSVRGRQFDVVDLPEYERFGLFLRPALARHDVICDRIALSLHGRVSLSASFNWGTEGRIDREMTALEDLQYQTADLRYGISRSYLDACRGRLELETHYLSPLRFLKLPTPSLPAPSTEPPNLQFIGRTEKCKGPDLFLDIAWWLPESSYGQARLVGPQTWDPQGVSSSQHLQTLIDRRNAGGKAAVLPAARKADLTRLFASRALTVLPSRFDTLNFVALESLFSGCPTAIGGEAGVCRFLEETFPDVPFIKIDVKNWFASLPQIEEVLKNYDEYRSRLVDAVSSSPRRVDGPDLAEIYSARSTSAMHVNLQLEEWHSLLSQHAGVRVAAGPAPPERKNWRSRAKRLIKAHTSHETRRKLRALDPRTMPARAKQSLKRRLSGSPWRGSLVAGAVLHRSPLLLDDYRHFHRLGECSLAELNAKANRCGELIGSLRADRVRLWRELARLEMLRENPLAAAAYRLRALRLAGEDRFNDLPGVVSTLDQHGYPREAATADAMFGPHSDREERCYRLLQAAFEGNRRLPDCEYELIDDRRDGRPAKASIIVSLYNAADKLPAFLRALRLQTLFASQAVELVLIDSGSPSDEYAVFRRLADELRLPAVYARSAQRETIQSAWNRGISLSRGEYLTFLGVDEGIRPQALEILAAELDANRELDWVQASSLMTNVDEQGQWLSDVLAYDRRDYQQSLVYLETCYLSWVGAMYRRNIHDRCGYYDASFGAAGDTEFKYRVLPFIKTKVIPQTLGVFWNYPSGQTTCSPRAEIEDLRAWYLHRTAGGARYAFENRPVEEVERLLGMAIRYRKSYCQHLSTDVEYAHTLARYLKQRRPDSQADLFVEGLATLLGAYRSLDYLPQATPQSLQWSLCRAFYLANRTAREHGAFCRSQIQPAYQVFNDNRHEQHIQIWSKAA